MQNFTEWLGYTQSSLVEQATPTVHVIADADESVSAVNFTEKDLDPEELGGTVYCEEPVGTFAHRVQYYLMYLAEAAVGTDRSVIGSYLIPPSTENPIPHGTALGSFSTILVYTKSGLTEQTTPAYLENVLHDTISKVLVADFLDFDLDVDYVGGTVDWMPPSDTSQVTHYILNTREEFAECNSVVTIFQPAEAARLASYLRFQVNGATESQKKVAVANALLETFNIDWSRLTVTLTTDESASTSARRLHCYHANNCIIFDYSQCCDF
eukprot:TRINITY_DN94546_c0_g1_i1.p1 TRINITY_DN94546_c0_g1~~TRINITY_DN94546_c0_g1_i1.p1  ORF type:complete len:268 (-),score=41.88 TRINITY_DN94546_c0_g1_i1:47-850(-)